MRVSTNRIAYQAIMPNGLGQGLIFAIIFHVGIKNSEFIVVQPPGFSIIILEIFTISRHLLSMLVSIQKHKNWSKYDQ